MNLTLERLRGLNLLDLECQGALGSEKENVRLNTAKQLSIFLEQEKSHMREYEHDRFSSMRKGSTP